jgi:hypothetical protein
MKILETKPLKYTTNEVTARFILYYLKRLKQLSIIVMKNSISINKAVTITISH